MCFKVTVNILTKKCYLNVGRYYVNVSRLRLLERRNVDSVPISHTGSLTVHKTRSYEPVLKYQRNTLSSV